MRINIGLAAIAVASVCALFLWFRLKAGDEEKRLVDIIKNESSSVLDRKQAIDQLTILAKTGKVRDESAAFGAIAAVLKGPSLADPRNAAQALGRLGEKGKPWIPALYGVMLDAKTDAVAAAIESVLKISGHDPAHVPHIAAVLRRADMQVAWPVALTALSEFPNVKAEDIAPAEPLLRSLDFLLSKPALKVFARHEPCNEVLLIELKRRLLNGNGMDVVHATDALKIAGDQSGGPCGDAYIELKKASEKRMRDL